MRWRSAEAAEAAANGLSFDDALALITIDAAHILGIGKRVGSLEAGKDGDVAIFDGDPFEFSSHVTGPGPSLADNSDPGHVVGRRFRSITRCRAEDCRRT